MTDILPECLIHKILCFLSFKEATKMSILSKIWLQASLTLPNLKFTVNYGRDYMKIVDAIMERYRDGKIPIEKFELSEYNGDTHEVIDKCLDIALQNGVKELVVGGCCILMPVSLSSGVLNCHSLRKLSLSYVKLDGNVLQTLLNSCPLIVSFNLKYCRGLKKIELLNLQKIKLVSIMTFEEERVKIQAPTLEHLSYSGDLSKELAVVECQNLKSLDLSGVTISDGYLQNLISSSQFLESLLLDDTSGGLGRFNICKSPSLKILKLRKCYGIKEIDAPNLVSIEYDGSKIPELKFARESSQLKHSKIILSCSNNVNAAWFGKLRKFLSNSTSWSQVSLYFSKCSEINMKDLQLDHKGSTLQVDVLNIYILSQNEECPTFVDALHWSCHPRRLNLSSGVKMNKCFIDRLMYMKNSSHSTSHGRESWHSQLIDIKAFDVKNQPLQLRSDLAISTFTERKEGYFLLDWQCS